ncbi:MAG: deoxyhypusine synthase family protein [Planctomycetota bacterium]
MHSRKIHPPAITGNEKSADLLQHQFSAFLGRNLREVYRLMKRSIQENCRIFATVSGAMTPAGMHLSCLIPLIEAGFIHCLTTTGANLYHDVHRVIGDHLFEVNPHGDDREYRQEQVIRIYDLGMDESVLFNTDEFFCELLKRSEFQRTMSSPEFHFQLGRILANLEDEKKQSKSLLATCYRYGVPIFVGAPQDGSIFLNAVKLAYLDPKFKFRLDIEKDVFSMAALQHFAREKGHPTAVWILGGGVPKNFTLQGEPLLSQIFNVEARGFDIDVQICVEVEDNGALSSCSSGEGHTWGKVSEDFARNSVYLRSDVTLTLPWLTHSLLSESSLRKPSARFYDHLPEALQILENAVKKANPTA